MSFDISAIFGILTNRPSDLIYHLVVSLSLVLLVVLASRKLSRSTSGQRARHVLIGSAVLLFLQITQFLLRFSIDPAAESIPLSCAMVEQLTNAMTIIWLAWTFVETDSRFIITGSVVFLSLVLVLSGIACLLLKNFQPNLFTLNAALLQTLWETGMLPLILVSLVLILIKRENQWALGSVILLLMAVGYIFQLTLITDEVTFMGAVRLAQTLGFPWLILLAQRFTGSQPAEEPPDTVTAIKDGNKRVDTKPELMDLLLKINTQETSADKYKAIVQALSLSVVADICYLARLPEEGKSIQLMAGYDLIRERCLDPVNLERDQLPRIVNAWEADQSLHLSQEDLDTREAAVFSSLLNYHRIGNLFAYPLSLEEQSPRMGGVIFLSPYTDKCWGSKTIHQMETIKETLAQVIFTPDIQEKMRSALNEMENRIVSLQEEKDKIVQTLSQKEALIQQLNMEIKKLKAKYQIDRFEQIRQADRMREQIRELTAQSAARKEGAARLEQLNESIRRLSEERDRLKTALERAEARIKNLESQTGQTGPIRLSMENQIISLDSIAANARLGVASKLQERQVNLEIVNPDGRQMIKTDPELLQTVLQGLLENAALASQLRGSIQLDQKLSFETGMMIVQVTDRGEGLTPADQKNLFSADYDSVTGIGSVSSIRNAVRAIRILNGKIWLRSKKAAFTTFRVQLPVRIID